MKTIEITEEETKTLISALNRHICKTRQRTRWWERKKKEGLLKKTNDEVQKLCELNQIYVERALNLIDKLK